MLATEPEGPKPADVVRVLCARDGSGHYIYGPVIYHKADNIETIAGAQAHNDAWDASTQRGALCGERSFGKAPFSSTTWGSTK